MAYLVGVLILVVGVLVSIGLHEVGHMVPAKKFGVRVSQYMVGFGPTLWSRTRGETEYGIKAIPLGGYVRLVGMYPPGDPRRTQKKGRIAEMIQSARDASTEEILPGEEHRAFYNLSAPKKLVVMLGGPFMNLVIAAVLMTAVLVGFGQVTVTPTVSTVSQCVLPSDAPADRTCTATDPVAPAAAAGIQPGDTIVEWGGVVITSWDQLSTLISTSGGEATEVVLRRDGEDTTTSITPVLAERPTYDENNVAVVDAAGAPVTETVGHIGVTATSEMQRQSITAVPGVLGDYLVQTGKVLVTFPQRIVDVAQAAFGDGDRDASSVVGVVGIGRFAGEIASADIDGFDASERAASLLMMLAGLNIALFAFNLVPLLPLDGGHVVGALYEGGKRQVARLRGLPRPGPADTARMMPLAYGVFVILTATGALLIYADVFKPIQIM